jgi:hypothetical protein
MYHIYVRQVPNWKLGESQYEEKVMVDFRDWVMIPAKPSMPTENTERAQ